MAGDGSAQQEMAVAASKPGEWQGGGCLNCAHQGEQATPVETERRGHQPLPPAERTQDITFRQRGYGGELHGFTACP